MRLTIIYHGRNKFTICICIFFVGVDSLFHKINCKRSAIEDMLGGDAGVNEANMIQYLGIIENRTNQLLTIQTFIENKKVSEVDQFVKYTIAKHEHGKFMLGLLDIFIMKITVFLF